MDPVLVTDLVGLAFSTILFLVTRGSWFRRQRRWGEPWSWTVTVYMCRCRTGAALVLGTVTESRSWHPPAATAATAPGQKVLREQEREPTTSMPTSTPSLESNATSLASPSGSSHATVSRPGEGCGRSDGRTRRQPRSQKVRMAEVVASPPSRTVDGTSEHDGPGGGHEPSHNANESGWCRSARWV